MKIKIIDLLSSNIALEALNAIPFKAIYAFKVKKAIKAVNDELKIFHSMLDDRRKELTAGLADGDKLDPESIAAFEKEAAEAAEQEVELTVNLIQLSWFARTNGPVNEFSEWHDFQPAHFQKLNWLINDDLE